MKVRKDISQQTMHEFMRNCPAISKDNLVSKLGRLKVEPALGALISSPLDSYPAGVPIGEVESKTLSKVSFKRDFAKLAALLGFSEVKIGSESRFNEESNTLYLSKSGALAAAALVRNIPDSGLDREVLLAAAGQSALPQGATPEQIAAAFFFLQLADRGVDGALHDLQFSEKARAWLLECGVLLDKEKIRAALYALQLEYAKALV